MLSVIILNPDGKASKQRSAFDAALQDCQNKELPPSAVITMLLEKDVRTALSKAELRRFSKMFSETLKRGVGADVSAAVQTLAAWKGLDPNRGNEQDVLRFSIFYAAFSTVRAYIIEDAYLLETNILGELAKGIVELAMKMWGASSTIVEAMERLTMTELYRNDAGPKSSRNSPDICGTLGLTKALEAIAYAALDIPETDYADVPVSAFANLAWGLAEGGIENRGLQIKIARGIIQKADKLTPPDIGYLFKALHEKEWFKDDDVIAYLTQTLVARIQEMKKADPGLAAQLASAPA